MFTVCLHHFIGCDLERIYRELEEQFPEITFLRCYMNPIMQKHGPTPDQKLRKAMYESLDSEPDKMDTKQISILGSDFALDQSSDLKELLPKAGYTVRELQSCRTWKSIKNWEMQEHFSVVIHLENNGIELLAKTTGQNISLSPTEF